MIPQQLRGELVMRILSAIALAACVSGCAAQPKMWVKPGAGTEEFSQAKYACLQQGQQPYSAASINRYGGSASGGMTTNAGLYNACMEAGGWALVDNATSGSSAYTATMKEIEADGRTLCKRPDLYPYYSWAPCRAREATPEQITDRAKVTAAEKPAFLAAMSESDNINARIIAARRQNDEKNGEAIAVTIEQSTATSKRFRQEYLEGRITRGEYNKRRRDIAISAEADEVRILRGN